MMIDIGGAMSLCERFEGLKTSPYRDRGVPAIGYGMHFYPDGTNVTMSDPAITTEEAQSMLGQLLLGHFLPQVLNASPVLFAFQNTANAILDFTYNLGIGNYAGSTLHTLIDAKNWDQAKVEILKWNHEGGIVVPWLSQRREAEAEMIGTDA